MMVEPMVTVTYVAYKDRREGDDVSGDGVGNSVQQTQRESAGDVDNGVYSRRSKRTPVTQTLCGRTRMRARVTMNPYHETMSVPIRKSNGSTSEHEEAYAAGAAATSEVSVTSSSGGYSEAAM
jgi:hypothetical protein